MEALDLGHPVWQFIALVAFLVPGLNATWVIERLAGPISLRPTERLYGALALSLALYVLALPWLVRMGRLIAGDELWIVEPIVAALALFFLAPALVGWVWARIRRSASLRRWISRWTHIDPAPSAWDFAFRSPRALFVRVRLTDGSVVAGRFGRDSYASSHPQRPDLFIEEVWRLSDRGVFLKPIAGTEGMLVLAGTIALVELFRGVKVDDG